MQLQRRSALVALLCCAGAASLAPAAHAAGNLGLSEWEAGTCNGTAAEVKVKANCSYASNPSKFYTQAAGHPPWGLTGFKLKQSGEEPEGSSVKRIRVDVPTGLAADPQALGTCTRAQFDSNSCPADSEAGFVELKAYVEAVGKTLGLEGKVYNLDLEPGLPLIFGIDVKGVSAGLLPVVEDTHLLLEG
ncbi:MAG TPA: hypothetical protein VFW29_04560, partial [Solirubrobacteraceae bacterium]|nr:hypothetical protein [Solirubrobacteraceae bacterium]